MSNRNVTLDEAKFSQLIPRLPHEILLLSNNRYKTAKFNILTSKQPSKKTHLDKLLHTLQLGECKPFALLQEMQDFTGSRFDAVAIRDVEVQRLPSFVQEILMSRPGSSLETTAAVAVAVCDRHRTPTLCATSLSAPPPTTATSNNSQRQAIKELLREEIARNTETVSEIAALQQDLADLRIHRPRQR